MTFDEVLEQVRELLQSKGRVAYRALKRRFDLDDEYLEDLKAELIDAEHVACDEDGKVLVWTGASVGQESENRRIGESEKEQIASSNARLSTLDPRRDAGERRQLTVMFCDLVGSTALSEQLDPEELRDVIRTYQQSSAAVIERYEGNVVQYLGDGLLVYFGYPTAHEDDARRAVRAGLEIIQASRKWVPSPLVGEGQGEGEARAHSHTPLQVRIGIHTGLVVVGDVGGGAKREQLALGETPNIAARVQSQAAPNEVVVSAATLRLMPGLFETEDLGQQALKGISTPMALYRVVRESDAQSRFEAAVQQGLTPLVGRDLELGLLRERWLQAKSGGGQVMLLSGEPGIGKSRLVQELKEQLAHEEVTRIEFRCSPYHQNSALYPIIDHLQRLLQFAREDSPPTKLEKLQRMLRRYRFPQADPFPLLASLLSLPHPEGYPPITVSPQKQKEKTQAALVAWLVEEAEQHPVYNTWEDIHWADPSTLEVLTLVIDQAPTASLYVLLTFRPEFLPSWRNRAHLSQITLSRLGRNQVETMVEQVTGGKALSPEVVQQIVAKTDGVPLFVEELTKTVMENVRERGMGNGEQESKIAGVQPASSSFRVGVPATLQDALMARLDRLGPAKEIAQLGATIGREFSYELLHAVSPLAEATLQQRIKQLVAAELVYQRGLLPQAHYLFKHALIQDTAYQSLLKSTRQQYHHQITRALEESFPDTKETQPELLAHHYTEAGLIAQAIPHWQQAGERASQRSANVEAVAHLTRGLEVLKVLPDTPERIQQDLTLQLALNDALAIIKGYAAPEVEKTVLRTQELCQQLGETPQLVPMLWSLVVFYFTRGELQMAYELAEQMMRLAQSVQDPKLLSWAHLALGWTLEQRGELTSARPHLEQAIALYDHQQHLHSAAGIYFDPRVVCRSYAAWVLWRLGYPDQALKRSHEALALAQELSHPFSLAYASGFAASFQCLRREEQLTRELAETVITLSTEQGFPYWLAWGTRVRGWALTEQGQVEEGIAQMQQGLAAFRAMGTDAGRSIFLADLATGYAKVGQVEEGLTLLAEAQAFVDKTGERFYESELWRLKGEFLLQSQTSRKQVEGESKAG